MEIFCANILPYVPCLVVSSFSTIAENEKKGKQGSEGISLAKMVDFQHTQIFRKLTFLKTHTCT